MSFDTSRFTFDPRKDYAGVVMEQGRVQTDADWNEWLAEVSRRIQAGTLDTMGHAVYPATTPYAFQIRAGSSGATNTMLIGVGRMYVDGLLVENHGDPASAVWDTALAELSNTPQPPPTPPLPLDATNAIDFTAQPYAPAASIPTGAGSYLAYLDVWRRPVTFIEDPSLVDSAIGVDTTGRVQTAWQVKLMPVPQGATWSCATPDSDIPWPASAGQLSTATITSGPSGPCCLTTGSGYTGVENQFYRVEIHNPGGVGGAGASFKWSRENGSVQTNVTAITGGSNTLGDPASVLTVQSLGRDQVLGFRPGDWIEVSNQTLDDDCQPGELCQIDSVQVAASTVTVTTVLSTVTAATLTANSYTRISRWDQSGKIYKSDNTVFADLDAVSGGIVAGSLGIPVPTDGTSLILEGGVTVTFGLGSATGAFQALDYWNFAARAADGTIDILTKAPPRGLHHHYTKLSFVTFGAGGADGATYTDCRTPWPPGGGSADCGGCCTVTVGDGVTSNGMFSSINQAVQSLPGRGGEVCILPGVYFEYVLLQGLRNVVIRGCGAQTVVCSPSLQTGDDNQAAGSAVITIEACAHLELTSFRVRAAEGEIGVLLDRLQVVIEVAELDAAGREDEVGDGSDRNVGITIDDLSISASTRPAIAALVVQKLHVARNVIEMADVESLFPAVYLRGEDMLFERNSVTVSALRLLVGDANGLSEQEATTGANASLSPGGVQVGGGSRNVTLLENKIHGGSRNGVTVGDILTLDANGGDSGGFTGVQVGTEDPCGGATGVIPGSGGSGNTITKFAAGGLIENLHIDRNLISDMGMCGIGPVGFFDLYRTAEVVSLMNVSITENLVLRTLQRRLAAFDAKLSEFGYGAISLPDVLNLTIRDNTVTDFGVTPGAEVCGIYVLHGEGIEISRNQIRETRQDETAGEEPNGVYGGKRAGIFIDLATPSTVNLSAGSLWEKASALDRDEVGIMRAPLYDPGSPALRIQENTVRVALGLALSARGTGPFSVVDNHFSTGGAVALRPESGREFQLAAPKATAVGSIAAALTVAILNLGVAIEEAAATQTFTNAYGAAAGQDQLGVSAAKPSVSTSGAVLFTNNICQYEGRVNRVRGLCSVGIVSLDAVLFNSNHLWFDAPPITAAADAVLFGITVQASNNRLQEAAGYPVLYSGLTLGLANITTHNLATYCVVAKGVAQWLVDAPNVELDTRLCPKG